VSVEFEEKSCRLIYPSLKKFLIYEKEKSIVSPRNGAYFLELSDFENILDVDSDERNLTEFSEFVLILALLRLVRCE